MNFQRRRMERVAREPKPAFQFRRPAGLDKLEVKPFVRSVDFVADDGVAQGGEMHADLVSAPGAGKSADDGKAVSVCTPRETVLDPKLRPSGQAQGMNHLFQPDRRANMRALPGERRVNGVRFPFRPAPDDREIFFSDPLFLHEQAKTARGGSVLRDQHQAAGLTIEPVDDGNLSAVRDLKSEELFQFAPERAGRAWLGRMHEQERRLFDDDEIVTLGDDREIMRTVCVRSIRGG